MSEEEKKAIEYIKEFKNEVFEGVGNKSIMAKNIDILLNLIDKQQKEIKKEKNRIMELAELLDKQENEIKFLKGELEIQEGCYISKDKIREKIKEITSYDYTSVEERECQVYARQVLKELLEES